MSIPTYQAQRELERKLPAATEIAIVGTVYNDGISLVFAGETRPSIKHYAYNAAVSFVPGQRVHITRIGSGTSGTYLVEYPIAGG